MQALSFRDVHFGYEGMPMSINGVSFSIDRGDSVALLGANGAGKSTTTKLINGLLRPTQGEVETLGMSPAEVGTAKIAQHVGYLFQNPDNQICQREVLEEILFGPKILGLDVDAYRPQAIALCERLGLQANGEIHALASCDRRKVALASVLVHAPSILVLDEPTTGLDSCYVTELVHIIQELKNDQELTLIVVTHDMEFASLLTTRALVLSAGHSWPISP